MAANRRRWILALGALWMATGSRGWGQTSSTPRSPVLPSDLIAPWRSAELRGSGQLRFLGMLIYEARLWVQPGWTEDRFADTPLALELEYARDLSGARIAERSLKEILELEAVEAETSKRWLARMQAIFPNVKAGDRITGLLLPGESAQFFLNGRAIGEVKDPVFARLFFGIWLSPQTSEPGLRRTLIGAGA